MAGRGERTGGNGKARMRVPPHDLDAEASLLGAMLLSEKAITAAIEAQLGAADFFSPAHGLVYDACTDLFNRGKPVDPVTVADELRRDGNLDVVGGGAALTEFVQATPAISNAGRYVEVVQEHALLRHLIGAGVAIVDLGYSTPDDVSVAVDHAETLVFDVARGRSEARSIELSELLPRVLDRLEDVFDSEQRPGVPTGFEDLDDILLGLQPGNLVVVGARPAVGKTSFALNLAANAALRANVPVLVFSLEMERDELAERLVCAEARVDSRKLRTGGFDDRDWQRITATMAKLHEATIYLDDTARLTVLDIRAKARRLKQQADIGLIVIDYLQLMTGRQGAESRQVEVAEMSRGLKILAKELSVPIVALSQLSRQLETRADKRPQLSDLRESGSVEQDSDVVLMLYRPDLHDPTAPEAGTAEVIVAKNRHGATGAVRLAYLPQFTKFENMARL